jgi:CheY-like chemotaxis protein
MLDVSDTREGTHERTVLVVHEDQEVRELLRVSLSAEGYCVAAVRDGRGALAHLRSTIGTCAILLDLMASTLETSRFRAAQLRDRSLAWIPIVAIAGGVDAAQKARAFGAQAFIRTPLDLDQVRDTLRKIGCGQAPAGQIFRDRG